MRERVGSNSYVVEVAPGVMKEAHRSQLKPHTEETMREDSLPLYYFSGKAAPLELGPYE